MVADDAPNSPQVAQLTGTGTAPVTLTPTSLAFASQVFGTKQPGGGRQLHHFGDVYSGWFEYEDGNPQCYRQRQHQSADGAVVRDGHAQWFGFDFGGTGKSQYFGREPAAVCGDGFVGERGRGKYQRAGELVVIGAVGGVGESHRPGAGRDAGDGKHCGSVWSGQWGYFGYGGSAVGDFNCGNSGYRVRASWLVPAIYRNTQLQRWNDEEHQQPGELVDIGCNHRDN
jgi:hypothetical protein